MPTLVKSLKAQCKKCGYKVIVVPRGDIVFMPEKCVKCGCENFGLSVATTLEKLSIFLIKPLFKRVMVIIPDGYS